MRRKKKYSCVCWLLLVIAPVAAWGAAGASGANEGQDFEPTAEPPTAATILPDAEPLRIRPYENPRRIQQS